MVNPVLDSLRVETRRLTRSGLLLGLVAVFGFFGLSGPGLALYMPEILTASTGSDQLTIEATAPTPIDGIALFNQSAMQLGLILAVTVAITSLGWDARPGSSIFYRTRTPHLMGVTLPRLGIDWLAVAISYVLALGLASWGTRAFIGPIATADLVRIGMASIAYLMMAMSIGHLAMAITRRTAPSIALSTILMLVLPLASNSPAIAGWAPTTLLSAVSGGTDLTGPFLSAALISVTSLIIASRVISRHSLRREA